MSKTSELCQVPGDIEVNGFIKWEKIHRPESEKGVIKLMGDTKVLGIIWAKRTRGRVKNRRGI